MKRILNTIGGIILLSIGLFYAIAWLVSSPAETARQGGSQYAQFIAAAFCLSVGTILAWRAIRKPVNDTPQNDVLDEKPTTLSK